MGWYIDGSRRILASITLLLCARAGDGSSERRTTEGLCKAVCPSGCPVMDAGSASCHRGSHEGVSGGWRGEEQVAAGLAWFAAGAASSKACGTGKRKAATGGRWSVDIPVSATIGA